MAYNGSGTFNRLYNFEADRDAGIKIRADRMDNELDGIATGLSNALCKDGQQTATANQPMGGFRHTNVDDASSRTDYASAADVQDNALKTAADTGSADAYAIGLSPPVTAYAAGQRFSFVAANTNTGASTLDVNSVGTKAIQKNGAALVAEDITAGDVVLVEYDGTQFQMLSPARTPVFKSGLVPLLASANTFSGENTFSDQLMQSIGTTEASASTLALDGDGNIYSISGTATITAVTGVKAGGVYYLNATGAWVITDDGDNIIIDPLAGGGTYTMGAGQVSIWYAHANDKVTFVGGHTLFAGQTTMEAGTSSLLAVTPGRQHFHPGHPKAWVKFNGTGTPAISRDYNVSSITDRGAGKYTVNLDITLSGTDAGALATVFDDGSADNPNRNAVAKVASTTTVLVGTGQPSSATSEDYAHITVSVYGDI